MLPFWAKRPKSRFVNKFTDSENQKHRDLADIGSAYGCTANKTNSKINKILFGEILCSYNAKE
jgi:hypothetical protein